MATVVLVHGIWSVAPFMRPLAGALRAQDMTVHTFSYSSVFQSQEDIRARLANLVETTQACALVGHSLGGLVAMDTLQQRQELQQRIQRLVCLGSPLQGSQVVRALGSIRGGRRILGHGFDALHNARSAWNGRTQVGVIAGRKARGLGQILAPFDVPSDGTVGVHETKLEGVEHHAVVNASHSGLLFCPTTAALTAHFLTHGHF